MISRSVYRMAGVVLCLMMGSGAVWAGGDVWVLDAPERSLSKILASPPAGDAADYRLHWGSVPASICRSDVLQARNRAQGFRAAFREDGFIVFAESLSEPDWSVRFETIRMGRIDTPRALPPAGLRWEGRHLNYDRGVLEEWLVNGSKGLEHGYTIPAPPEASHRGAETPPLSIDVAVTGELEAVHDGSGRCIHFRKPGSRLSLLTYGKLLVTDAEGKTLRARLELLPPKSDGPQTMLRILIEDAGAAYPLRVDPLLTSATWTSGLDEQGADLAWADWDGDGDLDLAVATVGGPNRVFENDGLGTATSLSLIWSSAETDDTRELAWGDWDNDGDLDLAVGNENQANRVYENDGLGAATSLSLVWSSAETDQTCDIAWGDWDGDGDLDLAVANGWEWTLAQDRVYENDGLGTATSLTLAWTSAESYASTGVAWGDWDGDGDLDLAVADNHIISGGPRIYRNSGGPTPSLSMDWSVSEGGTSTVLWLDWNRDGHLDLAQSVGNTGQAGPVRLYSNQGTGDPPSMVLGGDTVDSWCILDQAWGDWNGDGFLDLAFGERFFSPFSSEVYENDGLGAATSLSSAWSVSETSAVSGVAWGDWDNDGDLDLAVSTTSTDSAKVYENVGPPFPADSGWISTETDPTQALAWGDWDGDGDLDLAVGNDGESNLVYTNTGGTLSLAWSSAEADATATVAWGDWDGDGDQDLAVGNAGANRVYTNTGGAFSLAWTSSEADTTTSVAWFDWDGDGDLDLAVGNGGEANRVYANTGGALSLSWSSTETDATTSVAWGDWDGDGIGDLAVGNDGQGNRVYRNERRVVPDTLALAWTSAEAEATASIGWGDWDGDGDQDLAVGNNGEANRVYENDGLGQPTSLTAVWTSVEVDPTRHVSWVDVDVDGDLDLSAVNDGAPARLYLNDGLGTPASLGLEWSSAVTETAACAAWADADGDGDRDLATGTADSLEPLRIYANGYVTCPGGLPETPAHAVLPERPGMTDGAEFYSSTDILVSPVTILYTLYDEQGDRCWAIVPEYSPHGGGEWLAATQGVGGDGLTDLAASPGGTPHTFSWDSDADGCDSDDARFRIGVVWQAPAQVGSPLQRGILWAESLPFRIFMDTDGDGIRDSVDLCPLDEDNDWDGDGICGDVDNCPHNANPTQERALSLGDRIWLDDDGDGIQDTGETGLADIPIILYDARGTLTGLTSTDAAGNYAFADVCPGSGTLAVYLPIGYSFSLQDQGGDEELDSDVDVATGHAVFTIGIGETVTNLDCGLLAGCTGPDEPVWIYEVTLSDPDLYPILHFQDPNQPAEVTGYHIRRTDDPGLPKETWPLVATNVVDMDEATPNIQWTDTSGDGGDWYYQVTAYHSVCDVEGPF